MALELLLVVAILSVAACAVSLAIMPQVGLHEPPDALGLDEQTRQALHDACEDAEHR